MGTPTAAASPTNILSTKIVASSFKLNKNQDWMGRTCSTYGTEEKCIQGFGRKPEKETTWKTLA
jgi:hypothetical protein